MGNDGGSIPKRRELVKNAARNPNTSELKATQLEAQTHAWTYCPLSQRPLTSPIVSDSHGKLYNKEAILEFLLPSNDDAATAASAKADKDALLGGRVRSFRDVVEVKFRLLDGRHDNDHDDASSAALTTSGSTASKFERRVCPVTSKELGAHTRAAYLVPCGHAFSEAALRELVAGDDNAACLECSEGYARDDIIPILPVASTDVGRLATRAARLKEAGLTHALKKAPGSSKKRKKNAEADTKTATATAMTKTKAGGEALSVGSATQGDEGDMEEEAKDGAKGAARLEAASVAKAVTSRSGTGTVAGPPLSRSGIKNAATASLTQRVLSEQEERNKRRKLGMNENLKSLFSNNQAEADSITMKTGRGNDFMTRGFSVPSRR